MANIDFSQVVSLEDKAKADQAGLLDYLAHLRWQRETAGVAWRNGLTLKTDREARSSLEGVLAEWENIPKRGPVLWKCVDGWDRLDKRAVRKAVRLVHRHVQSCFAAEREVAEMIGSRRVGLVSEVSQAFDAAVADQLAG